MNTSKRVLQHPPNKNFSLTLLGNFQPSHEYFRKDYQKPKKYKQTTYIYEVDNSDDFFTNLPPCKFSKKNSMQLGMNKEMRQTKKLQAMEMALKHLQQRIAQQRDSISFGTAEQSNQVMQEPYARGDVSCAERFQLQDNEAN